MRVSLLVVLAALCGCASDHPEMKVVDYVDLDRFMGSWYVIANIPTFFEKGAHNAVETYSRDEGGKIATTFTYNKGSFSGKRKEYNPTGFVLDTTTNARWGMRFVWPIKSDYRIVYLDEDYSQTVVARQKRDFVWIMARTPEISETDYDELVLLIENLGYDVSQLQRVPQRW